MAGNAPQGPQSALQSCRLHDQYPGVPAQAQSQKQPQSGYWLRPHQLLDGKLAGTNKAKAASQPVSQYKEQPFRQNLLRSFSTLNKRDREK